MLYFKISTHNKFDTSEVHLHKKIFSRYKCILDPGTGLVGTLQIIPEYGFHMKLHIRWPVATAEVEQKNSFLNYS